VTKDKLSRLLWDAQGWAYRRRSPSFGAPTQGCVPSPSCTSKVPELPWLELSTEKLLHLLIYGLFGLLVELHGSPPVVPCGRTDEGSV
jgi:hypothetical protein